MVLVVPPGHALSRRKKVSVKQLCRSRSRPAGGRLRAAALLREVPGAGGAVAGRPPGRPGTRQQRGHQGGRPAGRRVAVLSAYAVQKELRAGTVHALEVSDLHCDREMYIVQDQRRVLPLPARLFLDFLETNPVPDLAP